MVEVYKTDIENTALAKKIVTEIRQFLPDSKPSFDLEDCDNVLRIEHTYEAIMEQDIREILNKYGHSMEILP